ncbi:unnamed protein product [Ectocarpus sp. 6 AP-2014]
MVRQRKQAAMEKQRAQQEKIESAENLRRALEAPPARPGWVSVVDVKSRPGSPAGMEYQPRRAATQGLRRGPRGKENRGGGGDAGGGGERRGVRRREPPPPPSSRAAPRPRSTSKPRRKAGEDDARRRGKSPPPRTIGAAALGVTDPRSRSRRKGTDVVAANNRPGGGRGGGGGINKGARSGRVVSKSSGSGGGGGNRSRPFGSHPPAYGEAQAALRRDANGPAATARRQWRPADGWENVGGGGGGDDVDGGFRPEREDGGGYGATVAEVEVPRKEVRRSDRSLQDEAEELLLGEPYSRPVLLDTGWEAEPEVRQEEREGGAGGGARVVDEDDEEEDSLDERLPFMLASLERVALTVHDLQGRCARLSRVLDEPRPTPPPIRPSEPPHVAPVPATAVAAAAGGGLYGDRPKMSTARRQLSAFSEGAQAEEAEQHRRQPQQACVPQQQLRLDTGRARIPDQRPAITVPTPVVLPPRQAPPLLGPTTSPPRRHSQLDPGPERPPYFSAAEPPAASPAAGTAAESGSAARGDTVAERGTAGSGNAWPVSVQPRNSRASPTPLEGTSPTAFRRSPLPPDAAGPSAKEDLPAEMPAVEAAWGSPVEFEEDGLGLRRPRDSVNGDSSSRHGDGGGRPWTPVAGSGITEVLRKLREPSGAGEREAERSSSSAARGARPDDGRVDATAAVAAAAAEEYRRSGFVSRRPGDVLAEAEGGDGDGLPAWMPRAAGGGSRGGGRARQSSWSSSDNARGEDGSSTSSGSGNGGGEEGGRKRAAGGFSLVSLVAGDIVRAQREAATRRRQEEEEAASAAAAAAAAAAARARELHQHQQDALLTASEDAAVADAVRSAARVVAAEESSRIDSLSQEAATRTGPAAAGVDVGEDAAAAAGRTAAADRSPSKSPRTDSRQELKKNLWDSLLQRGPALAPSRRQELLESSRVASDGGFVGGGGDMREAAEYLPSQAAADEPGTDGGEEEGRRRRRRLAPAELQAQLLNELRLHDDLQDAELQADALLAAQRVEEARREARVTGLLLRRERNSKAQAQADTLLQQQDVFEAALAQNDATHEARLRRLKQEAGERAARQAEAATVAIAATSAAALGAHGRQAGAAVAAVAAAGARAQTQQASAMAAQAAMFLEFQERAVERGRAMARRGARGGMREEAERERERLSSDGGDSLGEDGSEGEGRRRMHSGSEEGMQQGGRARTDFDSLLEHSPVHNGRSILHQVPSAPAAVAAGAAAAAATEPYQQKPEFWPSEEPLSPELRERKSAAAARGFSRSDQPRQQVSRNGSRNGSRASGRLSCSVGGGGGGGGSGGEFSPGRHMRLSHDGFNSFAAGVRRQQHGGSAGGAAAAGRANSTASLGGSGGAARSASSSSAVLGDGGMVGAHDLDALLDYRMAALRDSARRQQRLSSSPLEPLRRSGPLAGAGRGAAAGSGSGSGSGGTQGAASVEYAAVRREIELEREAMSRRTQEQLRELEGEEEELDDGDDDDERYTSFGSSGDEDGDDDRYHRRSRSTKQDEDSRRYGRAEEAAQDGDETVGGAASLPDDDEEVADEALPQEDDYQGVGGPAEDIREGSLHLDESLALELQESVVPLAAAGRPSHATERVAATGGATGGAPRDGEEWPNQGDADSIPDDISAASSAFSSVAEAVPAEASEGSPVGEGRLGSDDIGAAEQQKEHGLVDVPEEVASSGDAEEAAGEVPDEISAGRGGTQSDELEEEAYDSVSFEEDAAEDSDDHTAAADSEAEEIADARSDASPAARRHSQDFEASPPSLLPPAAAETAPAPLDDDGASAGLLSPPVLHGEDVESGGRSDRRPAPGGLRPGSAGSLGSMEAVVARRRDTVQQVRGKLEGLRESRDRVRAKRALVQQLGILEAEEASLLEQLPLEEQALAKEESELQQVMAREHRDTEAAPSPATATAAASTDGADLAVEVAGGIERAAGEGGRDHHQPSPSPPPWGVEKLWSDTDSDRGGVADGEEDGYGDGGGVEEFKFSAPPTATTTTTTTTTMAPEAVPEEEMLGAGAGLRADAPPPAAAVAAVDIEPDLLTDEGYVDVEPAQPPALADWIALGAAEAARDDLAATAAAAAFGEPPGRLEGRQDGAPETPPPPSAVASVAAAEAEARPDLDEDSFCSSSGGGGVEEGGGYSDADSEARLTALVARVAVRGEESRAALIVQALVRGRAARRLAAAHRGRECAREEAAAAAAAQTAAVAPPSPATAAGFAGEVEGGISEGAAVSWMAWKERGEAVSDSFGSSDSESGQTSAMLTEKNAREIAAYEHEHARLSEIAKEEEEAAVTAGVAALTNTRDPQEPVRSPGTREGREAEPTQGPSVQVESREEGGDDGDGSSASIAEEILEESAVEEVEDAPAEGELDALPPLATITTLAGSAADGGGGGDVTTGQGDNLGAGATAANARAGSPVDASMLRDYDHVEEALPPVEEEKCGHGSDSLAHGYGLEAFGFEDVEDAVVVAAGAVGRERNSLTAAARAEGGLSSEVVAAVAAPVGDAGDSVIAERGDSAEPSCIDSMVPLAGGTPAKEGSVAATAATAGGSNFLQPPHGGSGGVATGKYDSCADDDDDAYSESFEEDRTDLEKGDNDDDGAGGGSPVAEHPAPGDGAHYHYDGGIGRAGHDAAADAGSSSGERTDERPVVLSSVSEVCSEDLLAQDDSSLAGSFSIGRDYLEDALPPTSGSRASGGAAVAGGELLPWQALVFDASPSSERDDRLGVGAAAATEYPESSSPGMFDYDEEGGVRGGVTGVAASVTDGVSVDREQETAEGQEQPQEAGDDLQLYRLAAAVPTHGDAAAAATAEEKREGVGASGETNDEDDGGDNGAAQGLLFSSPSPEPEVLGEYSAGSFRCHSPDGAVEVQSDDGTAAAVVRSGNLEEGAGSTLVVPESALGGEVAVAVAADGGLSGVADADGNHSRVEEPTLEDDVAERVSRSDSGVLSGGQATSLDAGYTFIEKAQPPDGEGELEEGGDREELGGEAEALGAEVDQPRGSPPRLLISTPPDVVEPGPLSIDGGEEGASAGPENRHAKLGLGSNVDVVDVGENDRKEALVGDVQLPPGAIGGGNESDNKQGAWSGGYDFEEKAVVPWDEGEGLQGEKAEAVVVGDGRGLPPDVQEGDEEDDASTWSGRKFDFEEDAVVAAEPSAPREAPPDDDDGDEACLARTDAAAVAVEAEGERGDVGEVNVYRAWAAGGGGAAGDAVVEQEAGEPHAEQPLAEEESSRPEAPFSAVAARAEDGIDYLETFDHVEDAVRPPAVGEEEPPPLLRPRPSEDQDISSVSSMSDEGAQRGHEEEEEARRAVVGVGGDGATAAVLDSSHDCFGRGGGSDGDAVEDPSPVHEQQQQQQQQQQQSLSAEKQPDEVASDGPKIPAIGDVATATTAVAAVGVDAEHTVAPGSSVPPAEAQEEGRVPEAENGTVGGGSIAVGSTGDGDGDDSVSGLPASGLLASGTKPTSVPPLAADDGAVVVVAREDGTETAVEEVKATGVASTDSNGEDAPPASLWGPSRTSEDKERLVDDITDKLLASLLKRALGTPAPPPPGGRATAPEREEEEQHDGQPAVHATGDALVGGGASEDEGIGSRRGPAMWEEPGTYEDTDDDDDGDEEEERDDAGARGDWGTAAVTETYRSEEGMLMVVRDNGSDDSGGSGGGGGGGGGGNDAALGDSPEQERKYQQPEQRRDAEEDGEPGESGQPSRSSDAGNDDGSAAVSARLGDEEQDDDDDEYYFPPLTLARPKKPWMALAGLADNDNGSSSGGGQHHDPQTPYPDNASAEGVSFGVRTGGGGGGDVSLGVRTGGGGDVWFEGADMGLASPGAMAAAAGQGDLGEARAGGGGWEGGAAAGATHEDEGGGIRVGEAEGGGEVEGDPFMMEQELGWPEYPWWPVLADAIETALRLMTLEELNSRMSMHYLPDEPFIEELEGKDGMEFPPPAEPPLEDEAVIPARVIDELIDASDEAVLASLNEMEGIPKPDRDALDSARWMAYDAANEYLAERRSKRAPRRPQDPPAPSGKLLHLFEGFQHFRSMDDAVLEVTSAVLGQDGACLPGREPNPDLIETLPLDSRPEDWLLHEDDLYYVKCRVAEGILEELVEDTVQECKRVYSLREGARERWLATGEVA